MLDMLDAELDTPPLFQVSIYGLPVIYRQKSSQSFRLIKDSEDRHIFCLQIIESGTERCVVQRLISVSGG